MDSRVAYTEEIDDLDEAVAEIFRQTDDFKLLSNSMAILYTEEDTDYRALYEKLSKKWDFPIIGCTTMAMLLGKEGYCRNGISVTILTADDCTFSAGMTDDVNVSNYKDLITAKYNELKKAHNDDIKLIISFGGMVISKDSVAGDDLVALLNELGGGTPIYGGNASDDFSFGNYNLFFNGNVTKCGQVIALISGNIDPMFICLNSVENRARFSYKVTRSEGNLVYRLGNGSFTDTLVKENMLVSDKDNVLGDYLLSPFIVGIEKDDGDIVEVARNLSMINKDMRMGFFLGDIPENSIMSVGVLNRPDVQNTVEKAFSLMLRQMRGAYKYRTILCTSCSARFLALASNTEAEAEAYKGRLPEHVSLSGMYAYGEYCPLRGDKTGREYNMFHNFTFTLLAL